MSPPRPPRPALLSWPGLVLAAAVALSYRAVDGDVGALLAPEARRSIAEFARGFWPPAHSADFLSLLARPLAETVAIAFLGLSLALVLAAPLAYAAISPEAVPDACRPGRARRAAWLAARLLLNLMRSVPELVWALVFVRAFGLGPLAGVLAIGVGYAGVLGKVFAEILESAPRAPADALAWAGAPPRRAFAFGVLPSALPLLASYALYRFDCALRASAVLGLVGAGGIGVQLELSLKMFAYHEVATIVLALFALVAGVDLLSQRVRRRIHRSRGIFPLGIGALRARLVGVAAWALAALAAARVLGLSPRDLSPSALSGVAGFAASLWPPELDPAYLRQLAPAALVTFAVSVLGTALGVVLGLLLAWPAAHRLHALAGGERPGRARAAAIWAVAWGARALLNLGRTLPELVWAMVLIFAVGLGPFAGALALGLHTAGVLGRLYAEALEEVPPEPFAALRGVGASDAAASAFAVLPQAFPQLVAYTLYRWEVNIRASAVLGVVGAGGLGALLHVSLNLFQHHRTLSILAVLILLVTAVDLLSGTLRRRIVEGPAAPAAPRAAAGLPAPIVDAG